MRYRVTAPYVTVHNASAALLVGGASRAVVPIIGLYAGAQLPAETAQEDIDRLAAAGMIEPVEEEAGG